jgi:hypothetical protein
MTDVFPENIKVESRRTPIGSMTNLSVVTQHQKLNSQSCLHKG